MPIRLDLELEGAEKFSQQLGIAADHLDDFRKPLTDIQGIMKERIATNANNQGGVFGKWPARKREVPWPMMRRTGRLLNGFRYAISKKELKITNPVPYYPYHQSTAARSKLPRRPTLGVDRVANQQAIKAFQRYIVSELRKVD